MQLTDNEKLEKLEQLGSMIESDIINNNGSISDSMRYLSINMLDTIEECNESWCDNCKVRKALKSTCEILID